MIAMYLAPKVDTMRMIRKQLYIEANQQRKLRRLAARWECTEAQVIRMALDRLPDPEESLETSLRASGLLVEYPRDESLPTARELERLQDLLDAWVAERGSLGLTEAVLEERKGR